MLRLLERWRDLLTAVVGGFDRFPVAVVALGAFAIYVNLEIADVIRVRGDEMARAGFALVGAAAIATAVALFGERRAIASLLRHSPSLVLAAAVGAALWYWDRLGVAFPALFVAAVTAIPLAPYVRREPAGFWAFIWRLVHAAALAFIAVIVFCAGLSAIFASIDYLFGVDIDSSLYGHIWSIGIGFVGPLFALSLVPTVFPEHDTPDAADIFIAGLRILSDFVAVPLLAVYVTILHVYALKILIETELPKGQIGWMVLTFGLAVLALRVAVHPMAGLAWMPTRLFLRWWPIGLVVPLVLLVIALWQRVDTYGVTPERYALGLFALFLGLVLLAQIPRSTRGDIRAIPALGALALFVGSFGPWGMLSLSARSQIDRLTHYLADAGVLQDGRVVRMPTFSAGTAADVRSIVGVLFMVKQTDRLRPLFAGTEGDPFAIEVDALGRPSLLDRLTQALNVKPRPTSPVAADAGGFVINSPLGAVPIANYDLAIADLPLSHPERTIVPIGEGSLLVRCNGLTIVIETNYGTYSVPLSTISNALERWIEAVDKQPAEERPTFFVEATFHRMLRNGELFANEPRAAILFKTVKGKRSGVRLIIDSGTYDLFLRSADWSEAALSGEPGGRAQP